jgi:hypothetical protein
VLFDAVTDSFIDHRCIADPLLAASRAGALDRQALARLGTPRIDDGAAATRFHAHEKAVRAFALHDRRLVGSLGGHGEFSAMNEQKLKNAGVELATRYLMEPMFARCGIDDGRHRPSAALRTSGVSR